MQGRRQAGSDADFFRYNNFDMKNIIFLEIDKVALTELISRKHSFANDDKYKNNMKVLIQNIDLLEPYNKNIELINNV